MSEISAAKREALAELAMIEARTGRTPDALQAARDEFWQECEQIKDRPTTPVGTYIVIDLTANNAHCYPGRDNPPDFGYGVCRHGHGLQDFGDGYMTQEVATARAEILNAGGQATEIPNEQH